jgi:hypothetical protein
VDDLIRGLVTLAESDAHEPANLGNPAEMTLLEMAKLIIELTGSRSEIVFGPLPIDDPQVRQPDITRARQLLRWEPEIDVREGLGRAIEHYTATLGGARPQLKIGSTAAILRRLQSPPWADAVASRSWSSPPLSSPPARARSPWVTGVGTGHGLM